eukprot:gnl/Hemi2/7642_TR2628_c0_g1_i1.p1 gnl/Hemi2/7642_TR2628_c0_g1~~gnl/Hemi2/7642_TR2628_c0_g1_i1.p1  ORF type:complete len:524 (-),score=183.90 gnl/Hemi2/7642_TR2628_c0_g1_i1:28-1599(-)
MPARLAILLLFLAAVAQLQTASACAIVNECDPVASPDLLSPDEQPRVDAMRLCIDQMAASWAEVRADRWTEKTYDDRVITYGIVAKLESMGPYTNKHGKGRGDQFRSFDVARQLRRETAIAAHQVLYSFDKAKSLHQVWNWVDESKQILSNLAAKPGPVDLLSLWDEFLAKWDQEQTALTLPTGVAALPLVTWDDIGPAPEWFAPYKIAALSIIYPDLPDVLEDHGRFPPSRNCNDQDDREQCAVKLGQRIGAFIDPELVDKSGSCVDLKGDYDMSAYVGVYTQPDLLASASHAGPDNGNARICRLGAAQVVDTTNDLNDDNQLDPNKRSACRYQNLVSARIIPPHDVERRKLAVVRPNCAKTLFTNPVLAERALNGKLVVFRAGTTSHPTVAPNIVDKGALNFTTCEPITLTNFFEGSGGTAAEILGSRCERFAYFMEKALTAKETAIKVLTFIRRNSEVEFDRDYKALVQSCAALTPPSCPSCQTTFCAGGRRSAFIAIFKNAKPLGSIHKLTEAALKAGC